MLQPLIAHQRRIIGLCVLLFACAVAPLGACRSKGRTPTEESQIEAYARLVMPARLEVQRGWTKPVSYRGDGSADGLEVVLAAYDSAGELTKALGTFHLELQTRKLSERIGTRVAYWPIEIDPDSLPRFRDPLMRFYCFPLRLDKPLTPGRYVLSVWLGVPGRERLFDEYEFSYEGGTAPPPVRRP